LDLLDYRRRVAEMYERVRTGSGDPAARWIEFRRERDDLFRSHPQSALSPDQQARFEGLRYYPYDPRLRFVLPLSPVDSPEVMQIRLRDDGLLRMRRMGGVEFTIEEQPLALTLFWILGYGGGVFLPFRDATNADDTYEGGRYLLDTIKGIDLGQDAGKLVIDFNYAYNPSCAYSPRWDCPTPPPENWLQVPIRAGEQRYTPAGSPS
jgi:uncharacterized protein (DUF1684 family)